MGRTRPTAGAGKENDAVGVLGPPAPVACRRVGAAIANDAC